MTHFISTFFVTPLIIMTHDPTILCCSDIIIVHSDAIPLSLVLMLQNFIRTHSCPDHLWFNGRLGLSHEKEKTCGENITIGEPNDMKIFLQDTKPRHHVRKNSRWESCRDNSKMSLVWE